MRKTLLFLLTVPVFIFYVGCVNHQRLTKEEAFPLMFEEQPHVIAVLPPINNTTAAEAGDYYATTIAEPLNQLGFYVIPVEILNDVLALEGLVDTEVFMDSSMRRFGEVFGADAVLFTEIQAWDKNYAVISSVLKVSIDARLKSTHTDEVLWSYNGTIVADLTGQGGSSGNLLADILVSVIATAINTAAADYVNYARLANASMLHAMPFGRYRPEHLDDRETEIVFPPGVEPLNQNTVEN